MTIFLFLVGPNLTVNGNFRFYLRGQEQMDYKEKTKAKKIPYQIKENKSTYKLCGENQEK